MNTHSHDFVTVDMLGLKAALVARALAQRVSVSVFVRGAVARELGMVESPKSDRVVDASVATSTPTTVKLSIRFTQAEAAQLAAGARAAGLSRGVYLAGLIGGVAALSRGACRPDYLTALVASSAELSTLSRDIAHLTSLLRQGNVRAAQEYRERLDTLSGDVRRHLSRAARVLADLRPRSRRADASTHPTT